MLTEYQLSEEKQRCLYFKREITSHINSRKSQYQNRYWETQDGESVGSMTVEELVTQFNAEFKQHDLSIDCDDDMKHEILSGADINHLLCYRLFEPVNRYRPCTIRSLTNYIPIMESIAKITTKVFKYEPTDYPRTEPWAVDLFLSAIRLHLREYNLPTQKGRSLAKKQLKLVDDRFCYLPKTLCKFMEHGLTSIMAKDAATAYERNQALKNSPDITL